MHLFLIFPGTDFFGKLIIEGYKERPDSQCDTLLSHILQEGGWLPDDIIAACEAVDLPFTQVFNRCIIHYP